MTGRPGSWQGPVSLGGNAAGSPWPEAADGPVRVLWRGPRGALWQEQLGPRGNWGRPVRLRFRLRLGSPPFTAAGAAVGTVWAFWRGTGRGLWSLRVTGSDPGTPRRLTSAPG